MFESLGGAAHAVGTKRAETTSATPPRQPLPDDRPGPRRSRLYIEPVGRRSVSIVAAACLLFACSGDDARTVGTTEPAGADAPASGASTATETPPISSAEYPERFDAKHFTVVPRARTEFVYARSSTWTSAVPTATATCASSPMTSVCPPTSRPYHPTRPPTWRSSRPGRVRPRS